MTPPEFWQQIEELFHAAEQMEPAARPAFVAGIADAAVRDNVASLLSAHDQMGNFIQEPAIELAPEAAAALLDSFKTESRVGQVLGHFRIISPIGRGGMGEVYLAQDLHLARKVALKLLPPEFTLIPENVHRFEQEARAASALNHPNIITIHEIGHTDEVHFIATEYVEGDTLRRRLTRPLSINETLDIGAQIADALATAHEAGIIHRDVKPENVMLRPDGFIKVLDFGLARVTSRLFLKTGADSAAPTAIPYETAPGTIMGTVAYMSPEQTRGQQVDARGDLWSLGVVLYEMLSGQLPFNGATVPDTFVAILEREPASLTQLVHGVPHELERIVMRLLGKQPHQRYDSADTLAADLRRLEHQLEFAADIETSRASVPENPHQEATTRILQPAPPLAESQMASARAIPGVIETAAHAPPALTAPQIPPAPARSRASRLPMLMGAALLAVLAAVAFWQFTRPQANTPVTPAPAVTGPEHNMRYSLTVQEMRGGEADGKPYESSGAENFRNGWKFRLNLSSPQTGFLYLLDESPRPDGGMGYIILFPLPSLNSGLARLNAGQNLQTGWYVFQEPAVVERIWLIHAPAPITELESMRNLVNEKDRGLIRDPAQVASIQALLRAHEQTPPAVKVDKAANQTTITGRGDNLIGLIELSHR
ncbi:MAG: serine/threonine-protein kinase [Blastocatellia bacterium]